MTITHPLQDGIENSPPSASDDITQQILLQAAAGLLPEQEWCTDCTPGDDPVPDPEEGLPGIPQAVVRRTTEALPLPEGWGPAALYDISYLACGHTVAHRAF
ncbi:MULTISPECIES: hypothetical protein [Paenarthrobacter]|uniref:Uncharacterized protein n=1 Tax=Paenarthrobacter ureafaciens TaxID=37931 RepID=A0AAX3EG58_PAEUR|nr:MULTISPECIES: hypothetical protein [Paenarthrobacter]NKR13250.1 hypothetical protein [Arthrobacter sp. M5]NKR14900.1 hypothetical protein [Arthrobacter sp. M6]OEH62452.1 hypothetical protein A5N13_01990 [Arthrobacter sp. D4]OEH63023.1 hypothetical protein A5N17_10230 [Arthrobacter sp. D2]MDO5865203.1 hypothetical protein [Paenarthrobacter sp. SD-2]